jgi:hypothetical protein
MLARLKDQVLRRITLTAKPTSISSYVEGQDVSYWPQPSIAAVHNECPLSDAILAPMLVG